MKIVAHRGASRAEPENTPAAFAAADRMGADGVELDVRLAADGRGGTRVVVFHDPLPRAQHALDAVVGFEEVLDACGDRMLVNVEIKNSAADGGHDPTMAVVAPTIAAMRRRGPGWADRWLVSSFDMATIDHCRLVAPALPTALLLRTPTDDAIAVTAQRGHRAIHPHADDLTAGRVEACHRAGLFVTAWTCNDPRRARELGAFGVDGLCTDLPDVMRAELGTTADGGLRPSWDRRA